MNTILIIGDETETSFNELTYGDSETHYIMVDNVKHAIFYLVKNINEKLPNVIYIDYNESNIDEFKRACKECKIKLFNTHMITTVNGKYHQISTLRNTRTKEVNNSYILNQVGFR